MRRNLILTLLAMGCTLMAKAQVTPAEKQALQDLYNATNGPNWASQTDGYLQDDWNFANNVTNNWYGVTVQNGHVVELDLEFNLLMGSIPASIGNLVHLTFLNLSTNELTGSIPDTMGNLVNLQVLDLDNNSLNGNLPASLGNLSSLRELYIINNELSGAIPPEVGNLSSLERLFLYSNNLNGSIPIELGNLLNLTDLNLSNNGLSGNIPSELGNLSNLLYLGLYNNNLDGSIPPELGNLTNLTYFYLHGNGFNGSLPLSLGNLSNLIYLSLYSNNLSGTIPSELGNLTNLVHLFLQDNEFSGSIPPELGNLANLTFLYLQDNDLNGTIPDELQNLTSLLYLHLGSNNINGSIPSELGNMANLTYLNLCCNEIVGSIPPELGNLSELESLVLFNNPLSGTIPQELGNLLNLRYLSLYNANISGTIPIELGNLSNLEQLLLQQNNIGGIIPPELGNLANLESLFLQYNTLEGIIPTELGGLTNLTRLYLYNNNLSGSIPSELGNIAILEDLRLNNNNFSGDVPQEIIDQTNISRFHVQNNRFDFGNLEYTYQNSNGITFTYSPQQLTDLPLVLQVQEGGNINLGTMIQGTQNHYVWYKDGQPINGAPDQRKYEITGATPQDAGTYHCVMTSDIVQGLILTRHTIELSVLPAEPEEPEAENWNIITVWDYDLDTNLKANSRRYYDDLGKQVQTQSWDVITQAIWGQATLYDYQGRPALSTLSAPIPGQGQFQYHASFITNSGGDAYGATDFDVDPFDPDEVHDDGPLGKYYGGITSDPYQDLTAFPFSRTVFSELNPGKARAMVGGNKVDTNQDDSITAEDGWPQAHSFTMPATAELTLDVAFGEVAYKSVRTQKTVVRDVHGNETVVFVDTDGKLLAAARSGEEGALSPPMDLFIGAQGYVDVHIPKGVNTGISISDPSSVTLYNLITDAVEATPANSLPPGFYRVAVNSIKDFAPNTISVSYRVNYYDYSLNEYDEAGRLTASYQPVVDGNGDKLVTTYTYNTLGQLVSTVSPDEGSAGFKYRKDGQIRYSQNSEQALVDEVSYTDYDNFGRPVESGVLVNVNFTNLDPDKALPQATKRETMATTYDFLDNADLAFLANLFPAYQHPSFLAGNVAKTANEHSTTYYSYDGYGRVKWLVQDMDGLGTKTIDYGYEPLTGQVQKVTYQRDLPDQFVHRYTYNERGQLAQVETSVDGNAFTLQAEYLYNDAGTLVRTELAEGAQGLDYVYTLAGQLKSINHPSLTPNDDPGGDAHDLFGMQMDYHMGDYQRSENGNITTAPQGTDQFNGNIKGIRWQTHTNGQQAQYVYSYDRNNWLTGADFDPDANTADYDVGPITYDANGNIQGLVRNKQDADDGIAMDNLSYVYKTDRPNQLLRVEDSEGDVAGADDIGTQVGDNYIYNDIGQLTEDVSEGIAYIYTASGLVAEVLKNGQPLVKFFYNDRNHRAKKETYHPGNGNLIHTTYYVRDVAGQVMAVYGEAEGNTVLAEQPIYGAGRIGIAYTGWNNSKTYVYELTDHLGNVRAVFTKNNNDATLEGFTDYYPFGMPMPNRTLLGPEGYRYAFQGQEKDPETGKEAFQLRLWDGRIGRWLTTDPMGEFASPYLGMGNNPISLTDPDGGMTDCSCKNKGGNNFNFGQFMLNLSNPLDDYIFDENGNYLRTEITGSPDRLVVENSQTGFRQNYSFADPKNDPRDIKYGDIDKLVFVTKLDIIKILNNAGAFDSSNGLWYLYNESKGTRKLDFSYEGIPSYFSNQPGVSLTPQTTASRVLFVVFGEHTVHNHMNFGNFLWGAAGATLGFGYTTLQMGAHANSLLFPESNGYSSQWDSSDDQLSIILGAFYAKSNGFKN